jgi:aerobic carbon-monoxide dehydrogenase large subunit
MRRLEDPALLRGEARFVADVSLPGMLHAVVVRSVYPHARIDAVDPEPALALPGVTAVVSGADLPPGLEPIPLRVPGPPEASDHLQPVLARDEVRYVGEPVAVVVASDQYVAEDAAQAVIVDYTPLPAVASVEAGLEEHVACVLRQSVGDWSAAEAGASLVVEETFTTNRLSGMPIECRGLVADYSDESGRLTVWGAAKVPHFNRSVLARLLGLAEERVRLVECSVGGGFGVRGEFYPEDYLVPWLTLRLGRPVRWIEDRREHLLAVNHSREQRWHVRAAVAADGRLLGLRVRMDSDHGAYMRTHAVAVEEMAAAMLPGPYRVPSYEAEVRCVLTNKAPTGTMRGPGRYEATFVRERLMDIVAARVGADPGEVRRSSFLPASAMPHDLGTVGLGERIVYDAGIYEELLDTALDRIGYDDARRRQEEPRSDRTAIGIGLAAFVEKSGGGPWEYARVEVDPSGRVLLASGGASVGQGIATTLAQVVADGLGVRPDQVDVVHGDTDRVPRGVGGFASRVLAVGGSAAWEAAREVRGRALEAAGELLEAAVEDLELVDGEVRVRGAPGHALALGAVAEAVPLSAESTWRPTGPSYPGGVHACEVELDLETGAARVVRYVIAHDIGRAVNPLVVHGQLQGGMAQGLGGALLEALVYGEDGQPLTTSFMDYLLPLSSDVPAADVVCLDSSPPPANLLGAKGAGESGCTGAGACIANAIADALGRRGAEVTSLPLGPARVRELLTTAQTQLARS